jgi:hypothetical protein
MYRGFGEFHQNKDLLKEKHWVSDITKYFWFTSCSWFHCCLPRATKEQLETKTEKFKLV